MRKEHLIPIGKGKRTIYLDPRGKEHRKKIACHLSSSRILGILGFLCLLYCVCILLFMGYGTNFFLIWGVLAACCGGLSLLLSREKWLNRIPGWLKKSFCICCAACVALFVLVEALILSRFGAEAEAGADYVIVLGAQWKQDGPSYVLQKRLDEAIVYLEENPDTAVIVTGGQGSNEHISEAEGMYGYLMEAGIAGERILREDQATSTVENLAFSAELLDKMNDRVVLVTNDFHMFRALSIAGKMGYEQAEGLAAGSFPWMLPNNLLREFLGVLKDFLAGNL